MKIGSKICKNLSFLNIHISFCKSSPLPKIINSLHNPTQVVTLMTTQHNDCVLHYSPLVLTTMRPSTGEW